MPMYPPPPKKKRTGLIVTLVLLGALLLLCIPGVGLGYYLLSRSGPTGAVKSFLTAVFNDQDASAAEDLVCADKKGFGREAVEEMAEVREEFSEFEVTWDDFEEVSKRGDRAEVKFDLRYRAVERDSGKEERESGTVTFVVVEEDGWKVCGEADDDEDGGGGASPG